jgi:hypothetical protein
MHCTRRTEGWVSHLLRPRFRERDSSATALPPLDTIVIDVETVDPTGTGLSFVAFGENGYNGQTSPLPLP